MEIKCLALSLEIQDVSQLLGLVLRFLFRVGDGGLFFGTKLKRLAGKYRGTEPSSGPIFSIRQRC